MMAYESRDKLFGYLPITTEWFGEELRILRTIEPHRQLLGSKITGIDETPCAEVARMLRTVVPHANDHRFTKMSPSYIQLPGLLYGLGIAASPDRVQLHVETESGQSESVWIERLSDAQYEEAVFVSYDDQRESLPLYRQNTQDPSGAKDGSPGTGDASSSAGRRRLLFRREHQLPQGWNRV